MNEPLKEANELALEIADESAVALLESECVWRDGWLDTTVYDIQEPDRELRYLELRGLIERHPENYDLVRVVAA